MRDHWGTCITHFNDGVSAFIREYFSDDGKKCLMVAGAGFDPRSRQIGTMLHGVLGDRLHAFLVREERGDPAENLRDMADENETKLKQLIANTHVAHVRIFDTSDGASVGGQRAVEQFRAYTLPSGITDIVLDYSALSTGVGFPLARLLLEHAEASNLTVNFHVMIASNPDLDTRIIGEPGSGATFVRGFSPSLIGGIDLPAARIWLPHLAKGRGPLLDKIRTSQDGVYKVCPVLPFPSRNPRRSDDLIDEFLPMLIEAGVDVRDLIYVSEWNPLDSYRKISTLKIRYDRTVEGIYVPELVLSPVGSKVMAIGALMAAIEHGLPVQHVENLRYDYDPARGSGANAESETLVHVWLHGPIYAGYRPPTPKS